MTFTLGSAGIFTVLGGVLGGPLGILAGASLGASLGHFIGSNVFKEKWIILKGSKMETSTIGDDCFI